MNNEAYASEYIDHHIAQRRQNLSPSGTHPWAAHGCLEDAAGFTTDFRQLMGRLMTIQLIGAS